MAHHHSPPCQTAASAYLCVVGGSIWREVPHPQPVPVQEGQKKSPSRSGDHGNQQEACANFSTSIVHESISLQAAEAIGVASIKLWVLLCVQIICRGNEHKDDTGV